MLVYTLHIGVQWRMSTQEGGRRVEDFLTEGKGNANVQPGEPSIGSSTAMQPLAKRRRKQ